MILGTGDDVARTGDSDSRPVLIVTGLIQEARIAAGPGRTVICSSSNPEQLRSLLAGFDPASVRGVISFGVAGGLDPELESGDVIVATEVIAGPRSWLAGPALSDELIDGAGLAGQRIVRARLVGVEQVVPAQSAKAALRRETGAAAVDMESHIAADYATAASLPFAALRVISDPATRALPALAVNAVKPDGNIDLAKVLRGVARNPLVVRALVSTGRDFNRALRSLRGCQPALILQRSPAFAQVHHNRNHAAARRPTEVGVPTPVISALGRQMAAAGS